MYVFQTKRSTKEDVERLWKSKFLAEVLLKLNKENSVWIIVDGGS